MTDRDPRTPHHGGPGGPDQPPRTPPPAQPPPQPPYGGRPYGQDPYGAPPPRGQDPYTQDPYAQRPGTGGRSPYQPGPPQGGHPYGAPPPPGQQHPGPPAGRQPEYHPPLYRREEGVAGAGFALPDQYKTPVAERPEAPEAKRRQLFRLRGPLRIIVSVVALVAGTGVAVGLPYRDQLNAYDKQKKVALSYTTVPKGKIGSIAGTKFGLGRFTRGDSTLEFQAPAGTQGVKALLLYRSVNKKAELRMSYLEYVFRDSRGRTWSAQSLPDFGKSRVKRVEIKALVPKSVAGQVQPVVRPKQTLEEFDDPTQVPRDPALVFQH